MPGRCRGLAGIAHNTGGPAASPPPAYEYICMFEPDGSVRHFHLSTLSPFVYMFYTLTVEIAGMPAQWCRVMNSQLRLHFLSLLS